MGLSVFIIGKLLFYMLILRMLSKHALIACNHRFTDSTLTQKMPEYVAVCGVGLHLLLHPVIILCLLCSSQRSEQDNSFILQLSEQT